jgi:hypothetical protein
MNRTTHKHDRRTLKAAIASALFAVAVLVAACGPGSGGTTPPGVQTPPPGETQPAQMTPATTSGTGLGY